MKKTKILLDTDMGSDCDDAGALALLHNLAKEGKAEILAVTHCASEISGPYCVQRINEWYGNPDITVGRYDTKPFLEGGVYCKYTAGIMEKYLQTHDEIEFENATRVMRRVLAENEDVTLVTVGMFNNVAELLNSEGDDISPLSGIELIKKSVKCMYSMGGNFEDLTDAEFNIKSDIDNARFIAEKFPVPIVYCGFEIGIKVLAGINLTDADEEHPVRIAYRVHMKNKVENGEPSTACSWDPITVYCAVVENSDLFTRSGNYTISFDGEGRVHLEEGGKDCYIIAAQDYEKICNEIDKYIV